MGRLIRIRLTDVPLEKRLAAAGRAARDVRRPGEGAEILAAALVPSQRVHLVPEAAVAAVLPDFAGLSPSYRAAA